MSLFNWNTFPSSVSAQLWALLLLHNISERVHALVIGRTETHANPYVSHVCMHRHKALGERRYF